jgi:competence protein ComEA
VPPAAQVSPLSSYARRQLPSAAPPAPAPPAAACADPVPLNRATRDELLCLPGIGAVLAGRIIAERETHGAFRDIDDLARVPGIGRARIERLKGHVTIP